MGAMAATATWLPGNYRGEPIDGEPAEGFIQWKGTDVCFDFRCECGYDGHFDGYFAYAIQCRRCKAVYEMPAHVYPRRIQANENARPIEPNRENEAPARTDSPDDDDPL